MKEIYVNPEWTFKQTAEHLKALKLHYEEVLASFSVWDGKYRADFIYSTRSKFYALKCLEWQKDRMWNYMNDCDCLESILECASRYKKKKK